MPILHQITRQDKNSQSKNVQSDLKKNLKKRKKKTKKVPGYFLNFKYSL